MVKKDEFSLRKEAELLARTRYENREKYAELIKRLQEKANHFNTSTLMRELCASRTVIVKLKNGLPGVKPSTLVMFIDFIDRIGNQPGDRHTAFLRPRGGFTPEERRVETEEFPEDDLDFLN